MKEGFDKKTPVFGIMERGGRVRAKVIPEGRSATSNARSGATGNVDRERARS